MFCFQFYSTGPRPKTANLHAALLLRGKVHQDRRILREGGAVRLTSTDIIPPGSSKADPEGTGGGHFFRPSTHTTLYDRKGSDPTRGIDYRQLEEDGTARLTMHTGDPGNP
jgi:hypothetical protein